MAEVLEAAVPSRPGCCARRREAGSGREHRAAGGEEVFSAGKAGAAFFFLNRLGVSNMVHHCLRGAAPAPLHPNPEHQKVPSMNTYAVYDAKGWGTWHECWYDTYRSSTSRNGVLETRT